MNIAILGTGNVGQRLHHLPLGRDAQISRRNAHDDVGHVEQSGSPASKSEL